MLTGRRFDAEEALRIGLVADVLDGRRSCSSARCEAASADRRARAVGRAAHQAGDVDARSRSPRSSAAVEYEDRQQIMATFGQAPPEAVAAFLQKRPAEFAD